MPPQLRPLFQKREKHVALFCNMQAGRSDKIPETSIFRDKYEPALFSEESALLRRVGIKSNLMRASFRFGILRDIVV